MEKFQNMGLSESTLHAISNKGYNEPTAIQEMVFAVWLIVKGFNPSSIAALSAKKETNNA